jgi:hypothetical protein
MSEKPALNLPNAGRLAFLAATVAIEAPLKQGQAFAAYIPWEIIHEIRNELKAAGWPWEDAHARRVQIHKQTVKEATAKRYGNT